MRGVSVYIGFRVGFPCILGDIGVIVGVSVGIEVGVES